MSEENTNLIEPKRGPGRPKKVRPEDIIEKLPDYNFKRFDPSSLTEIFAECQKSSDPDAIIAYLKQHRTVVMDDILQLIYDKEVKYNVDTSTLPGQTKNGHGFVTLWKSMGKLRFLIRNPENKVDDKIKDRILHTMFDEILFEDYGLLVRIMKKQPLPNITKEIALAVSVRTY